MTVSFQLFIVSCTDTYSPCETREYTFKTHYVKDIRCFLKGIFLDFHKYMKSGFFFT